MHLAEPIYKQRQTNLTILIENISPKQNALVLLKPVFSSVVSQLTIIKFETLDKNSRIREKSWTNFLRIFVEVIEAGEIRQNSDIYLVKTRIEACA